MNEQDKKSLQAQNQFLNNWMLGVIAQPKKPRKLSKYQQFMKDRKEQLRLKYFGHK